MARQVMQVTIEGLPELKAALSKLFPEAVGERAVVRALRQVAKPVIADAKAIVGVHRGVESKRSRFREQGRRFHIRDSIKAVQTRFRVGGGKSRRYIKIGGSITVGAFHPLAHLKEFGTGPRYQSNGRYTGQMPAQPFMRPAWARNRDHVLRDLGPLIWDSIKHEAARLLRKANRPNPIAPRLHG